MSPTPEPQKKRRFSNLFKRKNKSQSISPTPDNNDRSHSTHTQGFDSAYASSEPPSTTSEPNIVPVENRGQIENVSSDRKLELNKSTGDVMDKDTGEVVSTVTTTTTTTTTTLTKKGKDGNLVVDVQTKPSGQVSSSSTNNHNNNTSNNTINSNPNPNANPTDIAEVSGESAPPSHMRNDNSHIPGTGPRMSQPVIPPRSPHRRSRDMTETINSHASTPAATTGYNFSHPSRGPVRQSGDFSNQVPPTNYPIQPGGPSNRSTMESLRHYAKEQTSPDTYQSLKAAAKGLHGVGETLRGAINNEIDHRIPVGHNAQAHEAAYLKNQQTLDRGREEMGRIPEQRESWATTNSTMGTQRPGEQQLVSPIAPGQQQSWPSRSPSRSDGGRKSITRKLIKKKSR